MTNWIECREKQEGLVGPDVFNTIQKMIFVAYTINIRWITTLIQR